MTDTIESVLTEELLAAYLDGMLSDEESNLVEELISADPALSEVLDAFDSIDSTIISEVGEEIPIECMADDFTLPFVGVEFIPAESGYEQQDFQNGINHNVAEDHLEDYNGQDYLYEPSENDTEETFDNNDVTDMSF